MARFREERPPSEKGAHHAAAKGGNTTTLKDQIGKLRYVSRASGRDCFRPFGPKRPPV
jgi:hypothetical protein